MRDVDRFERLAEEAIALLPEPLLDALEDAEVVVEDIPPEPRPGQTGIPLTEFTPASGGRRARATMYRRPLEARALGRAELVELVRVAVGRQVAAALGLGVEFDEWDDPGA